MGKSRWLRWDPCPLACAWNFNPPLCRRIECPIIPERIEIEEVDPDPDKL